MKVNVSTSFSSAEMVNGIKSNEKIEATDESSENLDNDTLKNEDKNVNGIVEISAEGMKKSKEAERENNLPESIQRINKQIKRIQAEIAVVKEKLEEIENSKLSEEMKGKQKEQYNEQLSGLNLALSSAYNDLKNAFKEENLDEQSLLAAAIIFSE